jgi:hypothetical protein
MPSISTEPIYVTMSPFRIAFTAEQAVLRARTSASPCRRVACDGQNVVVVPAKGAGGFPRTQCSGGEDGRLVGVVRECRCFTQYPKDTDGPDPRHGRFPPGSVAGTVKGLDSLDGSHRAIVDYEPAQKALDLGGEN